MASSDSSLRQHARLSQTGSILGTLMFAASLTPSLLPRSPAFQGVVSGLSLALGYAIGAGIVGIGSYLGFHVPRGRTAQRVQLLSYVLLATAVAITLGCLWRATTWQNAVRELMGMELVDGVRPFRVALVALMVFAVCLLSARLMATAFHLIAERFRRYLPPRVGNLLGLASVGIAVWVISDGIVFKFGLRAADASFREIDALIPDDREQPIDSTRSGSAASFVDWQDLGRQGRLFVTTGPSASDISTFTGTSASQPIRVYVGLNAAATPKERAQLALRELRRIDAFNRSVMIIATPTGTGWLDPSATNSLEYLHRGDVAIVAAQYSYLPSALSLATEGAYGAETAAALFEEVYNYWTTLPRDERPRLYVFGVSLGALNADRSFDLHDILSDPFHGALWAGMPFRSSAMNEIIATRQPTSPAWLPKYRNSSVVRFMNQNGGLRNAGATWAPLRIAYLQYASDPVTYFNVRSFYREPEWMRAPRGPDVVSQFRWYPVVTGLQLIADIAAGVDAAPPGYGHNFAPGHYIEAWHAITEPEGWSYDELARLERILRRK